MTITLTEKECGELWAEAEMNSQENPESNEFLSQVPKKLGTGYVRSTEVHPHLWLSIFDYGYHENVQVKTLDCDHPLQFCVFLSGIETDEYGGQLDKGHTLISGSGVQRGMIFESQKSQRFVGVGINMQPELLRTFSLQRMAKLSQSCACWQRVMTGRHYFILKSHLQYKG
ncbi:hypothetical protein [Nostoc sp.]|uniref:hypothetical protein n=1 Tax=Nostoc sp. TaxID=1180 RepID=UPI002FF4723E